MPSPNNADKTHFTLSFAVGHRSKNIPNDVLKVQKLLNFNQGCFKGSELLDEDGICGNKTITQIRLFQKNVSKFVNPDSIVTPLGRTYQDLIKRVNLPREAQRRISPTKTPPRHEVDISRFMDLFVKQFPSMTSHHNVRELLRRMLIDRRITDLRWIPYVLATILRECGQEFKPVNEIGLGRSKPYGRPEKFKDPETSIEHNHVYYGRGYCQLTWLKNYITLGKQLGLGYTLASNPALALDKDIAYDIIIHGMTKGSFTGVGLARFINGEKYSYFYARQIINGLDHAQEVAENATAYLSILNASRKKR